MDLLSYKDIELQILKVGFSNVFSEIRKYMSKNKPLDLDEYLTLFDLAETFKQGKYVLNQLVENRKGYLNRRNLAIRVMWKELVDENDIDSAISFYRNSFSDSVSLERLHNPVMIHYEKTLQQKRLQELQNKYRKVVTHSIANSKPEKTTKYSSTYPRSEKVKRDALEKAEYQCVINNNHRDFISRATNKNYVEVHHLMPISYQNEYQITLDCVENIVCLCAACHRLLHLGKFEDKKPKIDRLFLKKQGELNSIGLNIDLKRLYEIYSDVKIEDEE